MKNIIGIVQARTGSKRLPGKVLKKIGKYSLIELLLKRLSKSKKLSKVVLATTKNKNDDYLTSLVSKLGYEVYRGSEDDVLSRYFKVAQKNSAKYIVRITGDCPLVDSKIVDDIVNKTILTKSDYCSNVLKYSFPDGFDVEVFNFKTLTKTYKNSKSSFDKEHVTPFMIRDKKIKKTNFLSTKKNTKYRVCVDEQVDLDLVSKIFKHFSPKLNFSYLDIIKFLNKNKNISNLNQNLKTNEGSFLKTGQKLWKFAKSIIPNGSMLLSKNPDRYLPNLWPVYFDRAKGCEIWDLDGIKYYDLSNMGVGTNVLGYCNKNIDKKVSKNISKGNLSTLLCPEEVELSKKLIEIHPWAKMTRFARTGGEANSVAIRIARNYVKDDKVAICGYHGWHDWYLSANLKKNSLDNHLLKGLRPNGVPRNLKNTVFTFEYNDFNSLKKLVQKYNIKIIKMEVIRNIEPKNNFLKKIRKLADQKNIILIFDECTTGFRETYGGIHKKYGVVPDLAIFGKALGNGYAITAIIGKKDIMKYSENTFISSTFWTERIGPTAALATLDEMKKIKSWEIIKITGKKIKNNWKKLSLKHKLPLKIYGPDSLCKFEFKLKTNEKYKTFLTQEMLKRGFLATNSIYVSVSHNENIIRKYLKALDYVFSIIKKCEKKELDIMRILKTTEPLKDFQRLN